MDFPDTITIEITQADINQSFPCNVWKCPMSTAFNKILSDGLRSVTYPYMLTQRPDGTWDFLWLLDVFPIDESQAVASYSIDSSSGDAIGEYDNDVTGFIPRTVTLTKIKVELERSS